MKLSFEQSSEDLGRRMNKSLLISSLWEFDIPNSPVYPLEQKLLNIVNNPERHYEVEEDFQAVLDDLAITKQWVIDQKLNKQPYRGLVDYCIGWAIASKEKVATNSSSLSI